MRPFPIENQRRRPRIRKLCGSCWAATSRSPLGRRELEKVAAARRPRAPGRRPRRSRRGRGVPAPGRASRRPAARGAAIRVDFDGLPDAETTVHKLRIEGASLEPKEIFDLFSLLDRAADAKSCSPPRPSASRAWAAARKPSAISARLLKDLEGKILPDGSVADHASVALARLRRDIERQKKAIQESLERFLRAHREEGVLQEEFVTIRNERFVVPVIAGQRRKLDGVIHGASCSGHTLFVEPLETIDLNNELVRLTEEEVREVHRILLEMTDRLRGYADSIRQTLVTMAELELIFAKGRFAVEFDCVIPRFGDAPAAARRAPSAARRRAAPPPQEPPCRSAWS